jgi:hypothetical protein
MAKARPASQGAIMADIARYTGLAEYYLVEKEAGTLLRSHEAAAARYSALAAYHLAKEGSANP